MKTVTILKGLPASGKSTWAKQQIDDKPHTIKRVNKDELRAMLDNSHWSKGSEELVLQVRNSIILSALEAGKHVVVDDTNLDPKHEETIRELVKGKAQVIVKMFEVSVEEAIERDSKRDKSVGEKVILEMYHRYLKKELSTKYVPPLDKPKAFIFDIDGTLAKMNGRSPYDYTRVSEDVPNQQVIDLCNFLSNTFHIIIFSGRDYSCRQETVDWLWEHNVSFHHFDLRPEGNKEDDRIIKQRMFDKIKNDYNVVGVFDDRDRVVQMWRDNGLQCYQVDYGNF